MFGITRSQENVLTWVCGEIDEAPVEMREIGCGVRLSVKLPVPTDRRGLNLVLVAVVEAPDSAGDCSPRHCYGITIAKNAHDASAVEQWQC